MPLFKGNLNGPGELEIDVDVIDEKVKVSSNDQLAEYLEDKLVAGDGVTITILNEGGTEQMMISAEGGGTAYEDPDYLTFTNNVNAVEIGSTVTQVIMNWTRNKDFTSQSLNQGIGGIDPLILTHTHNTSFTTNRTYTITGGDGIKETSESTNIYFRSKRYWGVNNKATQLNDAEIIALGGELATSRLMTKTFDCTNYRRIWICYPQSFGVAHFRVGGFENNDFTRYDVTHINASGGSVAYYLYRYNWDLYGDYYSIEVY